ncbi:MAG: dihydrodipicolinate synthase family protein [Alphaproteobacteria bacterium]|nr:dihydrodipicolinate synthase family protein [Alphaproteobacteria bacterium]
MTTQAFAGILSPVLTPFDDDLRPNGRKLAQFCKSLLAEGCTALAPFGTNSEANSMSVEERMELLDQIVAAGVDPKKLMPGTGACALSDAVKSTKHAVAKGCGGVLVLPPFYYKGMSDDGFYRFFSETIQRVGDARLRMYLYHIPPQTVQGISHDLIERLIKAYPATVVGIKDSSGDWKNTEAMLKRFPGVGIFAGSEDFLLANMRAGGVGCITATGNVNAGMIRKLYDTWQQPDADQKQAHISTVRKTIQRHPMIPSMKSLRAAWSGDKAWLNVLPPFLPLTMEQGKALAADVAKLGCKGPEMVPAE